MDLASPPTPNTAVKINFSNDLCVLIWNTVCFSVRRSYDSIPFVLYRKKPIVFFPVYLMIKVTMSAFYNTVTFFQKEGFNVLWRRKIKGRFIISILNIEVNNCCIDTFILFLTNGTMLEKYADVLCSRRDSEILYSMCVMHTVLLC